MAFPFQIHSQKRIVQAKCEFARNVNVFRQRMSAFGHSSYQQTVETSVALAASQCGRDTAARPCPRGRGCVDVKDCVQKAYNDSRPLFRPLAATRAPPCSCASALSCPVGGDYTTREDCPNLHNCKPATAVVGRAFMAEARDGKPNYLDVLVVAAAPVDLRPALNLGVELARLENMVRRSAIPIRMRRVFPPTYAQLEKELSGPELERRRREPRVLHFLGHGEMDGLWFEREDGSGERIPTNRIVRLLRGSPIKLALLNACWSATNLVASLCDRLTKEGGIPAAIGHGSEVADASAIEFAREFYRHVVLGKSVGAAKNLAANKLAEQGKPGATEVELKGDGTLLLADDLAEGDREGRVEDGLPLKGSLPGAAFFAGRHQEFTEVAATLDDTQQVAYGLWGIGGSAKRRWRWSWRGETRGDTREGSPGSTRATYRRRLRRGCCNSPWHGWSPPRPRRTPPRGWCD